MTVGESTSAAAALLLLLLLLLLLSILVGRLFRSSLCTTPGWAHTHVTFVRHGPAKAQVDGALSTAWA